tara:strand:+ start:44 stop:1051 length:1008 start_codon:yes stop_codon:yes gene_type:complete
LIENKKIIVIDNSNLAYSGEDINGKFLRGTETSLILLSEFFVKKGFSVDYCNCINNSKIYNGVKYFNKNQIDKSVNYDLAIAISDANQFNYVKSKKKALFSVSNQPIEKFIRKKQLFAFIKYKPIVVTLCNYQFKKRSFFTSFYGKKTIPITVDPIFLKSAINKNSLPPKKVVYNIRSNRNLDALLKIWVEKIFPNNKESEFHITPGLVDYNDNLKSKNVFLRKIGTRSEMINEMSSYRALVYLGHKSDIFTLTAEEAVRLCVPVVTYGIGSLIDRVSHNLNGFIAQNDDEFSFYVSKLLQDDKFYLELKNKMFDSRENNTWDDITDEWINFFLK